MHRLKIYSALAYKIIHQQNEIFSAQILTEKIAGDKALTFNSRYFYYSNAQIKQIPREPVINSKYCFFRLSHHLNMLLEFL